MEIITGLALSWACITAAAAPLPVQDGDIVFQTSRSAQSVAVQRALGVTIGEQERIKDFNLSDPAVRQKMKERYGDKVPLNEPVVSPVAMFDSPRLVTVAQR